MQCPYCKYTNGWDNEKLCVVEGDKGDFYSLSNEVKMERSDFYSRTDITVLVGCPKCMAVFMSY